MAMVRDKRLYACRRLSVRCLFLIFYFRLFWTLYVTRFACTYRCLPVGILQFLHIFTRGHIIVSKHLALLAEMRQQSLSPE